MPSFIILNETVQLGEDPQWLLTSQKQTGRYYACLLMHSYNTTYEVFLQKYQTKSDQASINLYNNL
jgi:hypothetical protein